MPGVHNLRGSPDYVNDVRKQQEDQLASVNRAFEAKARRQAERDRLLAENVRLQQEAADREARRDAEAGKVRRLDTWRWRVGTAITLVGLSATVTSLLFVTHVFGTGR